MNLNETDEVKFKQLSEELASNSDVLKMKDFIQHGRITTYDHCLSVSKTAFALAKKLHMNVNEDVLVKAGMLHDFYLYDWHKASIKVPLFQMHGYTHAKLASKLAIEHFNVNERIQKAIETHMWPLTLRSIPTSKEAWLICVADKLCAVKESIFER